MLAAKKIAKNAKKIKPPAKLSKIRQAATATHTGINIKPGVLSPCFAKFFGEFIHRVESPTSSNKRYLFFCELSEETKDSRCELAEFVVAIAASLALIAMSFGIVLRSVL